MTLKEQLEALLGPGVVSTDPETLAQHGQDKWFASHAPEAVVFAESTDQVSRLLALRDGAMVYDGPPTDADVHTLVLPA